MRNLRHGGAEAGTGRRKQSWRYVRLYSGMTAVSQLAPAVGCAADARLLSYQPQRPADAVAGD